MKEITKYYSVFIILCGLALFCLGSQVWTKVPDGSKPGMPVAYSDSLDKEALINVIREATKPFLDYRKAQAAGYKPLGPDMPNMGTHWINTSLAVNRVLDFEKPSTLTYLNIDGRWKLTGVAYTYPVKSGEHPPNLPLQDMRWHFHSGSLEKEAHGIHSEGNPGEERQLTALAMIHVWVWSDNPDGLFAADNWALAYDRVGLQIPDNPSPRLSKALYLADGGIAYFQRFADLCVEPHTLPGDEIHEVMQEASEKIKVILEKYHEGTSISLEDITSIENIWDSMWASIKPIVGENHWNAIATQLHPSRHHQ